MELIIQIFPDLDQLTNYFVSRISDQLLKKTPGQYFSVALSGGSTPTAIFKIITEKYKNKIDWSRIVLFWGDERCVPPRNKESNYRMTFENLLKHQPPESLNFCRIMGEGNPAAEAKRYSGKVETLLPRANEIPQFDLILLGLGEDGHTASIFPHNIGLFNSDHLFEVSEHPVTGQIRITATGKLINNAREVCFLVTGPGKAEKVAQIIHRKEGWEQLPASKVHPASGQLIWLLDEAAGSGL